MPAKWGGGGPPGIGTVVPQFGVGVGALDPVFPLAVSGTGINLGATGISQPIAGTIEVTPAVGATDAWFRLKTSAPAQPAYFALHDSTGDKWRITMDNTKKLVLTDVENNRPFLTFNQGTGASPKNPGFTVGSDILVHRTGSNTLTVEGATGQVRSAVRAADPTAVQLVDRQFFDVESSTTPVYTLRKSSASATTSGPSGGGSQNLAALVSNQFLVVNGAGFTGPSAFYVAGQRLTFSGRTGNTLTGVSPGVGTVADGTLVTAASQALQFMASQEGYTPLTLFRGHGVGRQALYNPIIDPPQIPGGTAFTYDKVPGQTPGWDFRMNIRNVTQNSAFDQITGSRRILLIGNRTTIVGNQTLPRADNILTVASTAESSSSGKLIVKSSTGWQTLTYTNKTNFSTFTGVSGGTGTVTDGTPVRTNPVLASPIAGIHQVDVHWFQETVGASVPPTPGTLGRNEPAAVFATVRDFTPPGAEHAQIWLFDTGVHGAVGETGNTGTEQQTILSNATFAINNYYNGDPSLCDGVGVTITSKYNVGAGGATNEHLNAQTYPVTCGLVITGTSGTTQVGQSSGFKTAIRIGGGRAPWFADTTVGRVGRGIEIRDFAQGIVVHRRDQSLTAANSGFAQGYALRIGQDSTDADSASPLDGISFGATDNIELYRAGAGLLTVSRPTGPMRLSLSAPDATLRAVDLRFMDFDSVAAGTPVWTIRKAAGAKPLQFFNEIQTTAYPPFLLNQQTGLLGSGAFVSKFDSGGTALAGSIPGLDHAMTVDNVLMANAFHQIVGFRNKVTVGTTGAVRGTPIAQVNTVDVLALSSPGANRNETAFFYASVKDQTADATPHAAMWGFDVALHGAADALGTQDQLTLGVFHVNKYTVNALTAPALSSCLALTTRFNQGAGSGVAPHQDSATFPVDVALHIVGTSGTSGNPFGVVGFDYGILIGGTGAPWYSEPTAPVGKVDTGIEVRGFNTAGIVVTKRTATGVQGPAISIGWDSTGTASANLMDGIDFGADFKLYRTGADALRTDASFRAEKGVVSASTGTASAASYIMPSPINSLAAGGALAVLAIGTLYKVAIRLPSATIITGVKVLANSAAGAEVFKVVIYSESGAQLGLSAATNFATGTNVWTEAAISGGAITVPGPQTIVVGVVSNNAVSTLHRYTGAAGSGGGVVFNVAASTDTSGSYATPPATTSVPTTYVADVGPIVALY